MVVRQHLLDGFDAIWIDSLNGDSRETGKLTPTGGPDPSVFSTEFNREGIRLGTAIGLYVRRDGQTTTPPVRYQDFWGVHKREELFASLGDPDFEGRYAIAAPTPENRYTFRPWVTVGAYVTWPSLVELAEQEPFSGLSEKRKGALIGVDRNALADRMRRYLDPQLSFATVGAAAAGLADPAGRFDPEKARTRLLVQEPFDEGRLRRYAMYPLDQRWCYHTEVRPIWNEPRPALAAQVGNGNLMIVSRLKARRPDEGVPVVATTALVNHHLLDPNAHAIPIRIRTDGNDGDLFGDEATERPSLSATVRDWLTSLGWPDPDTDADAGAAPWLHALAICYAPAWLAENRDGILADWPRVPLPASAEALSASAALGGRLAALLDPDEPVQGVTTATTVPPLGAVGAIMRTGGGQLASAELAVTAGWGHGGAVRPVMPGQGRLIQRDAYTADELAQIKTVATTRGEATADLLARLGPPVDVWLNDVAYWRTVPRAVWEFRIGGYQVVKKWLSYREAGVLGRPLTPAEAREVTGIVRRLAAIVLMQPDLDANYQAIRDHSYGWQQPETRALEGHSEPRLWGRRVG